MTYRRGHPAKVLALTTASMLATPWAFAEVTVRKVDNGIEVQAKQSTVRETLQAISAANPLELHGVDGLTEPLNGTFKGDVRSVVGKVLAGRDHFMRPAGDGLAVFVTDTRPATATAAVAPAVAPTGDPVKDNIEGRTPVLSPEGQKLAVQMFGEKGRYLQVDETLLRSFATGRGGRRFHQPQ